MGIGSLTRSARPVGAPFSACARANPPFPAVFRLRGFLDSMVATAKKQGAALALASLVALVAFAMSLSVAPAEAANRPTIRSEWACSRFPDLCSSRDKGDYDEECREKWKDWESFASRARFRSEQAMERFKKNRLGDCYDWKEPPARPCCRALSVKCLACVAGMTEEEYCEEKPNEAASQVCPKEEPACCKALNAKCLSCAAGVTEEEFCESKPETFGCPEPPRVCCLAYNAPCLACAAGMTETEFCDKRPNDAANDVCPKEEPVCCEAITASCEACRVGLTKEEYCEERPNPVAFEVCPSEEEEEGEEEEEDKPKGCCKALTAQCLACVQGVSQAEYCEEKPKIVGCKPPPEDPKVCCDAIIASCEACKAGVPEKEYCSRNPRMNGCSWRDAILFDGASQFNWDSLPGFTSSGWQGFRPG